MHIVTPRHVGHWTQWACVIGLVTAVVGCCPQKLPDGTPVAWPGTGSYKATVKSFAVSPADAYGIAHEAAVARGQEALSERPLLIVGGAYLFSTPNPRGVWLTGYYVDGQAGSIEYRKPDRMLYCGPADSH